MEDKCYFCNATPYGRTNNIAQQIFADGAGSTIRLIQNTNTIYSYTSHIPDKGSNVYTVIGDINYCPMCGRELLT